jgi:hypothetical protein
LDEAVAAGRVRVLESEGVLVAVPTISTITPSTLSPMARAIMKVEGTGFNVPTIPIPNPGMKAYIDGTETTIGVCTESLAYVASIQIKDLIDVESRAATLRLVNIDAIGDPIPDEEVEAEVTYTKDAILKPAESPFICQAYLDLIRYLRSNYKLTIAQSTDFDYTLEGELKRVVPEPPAIVLSDFALEEDRTIYAEPIEGGKRYRYSMYFTLRGNFVVVAKKFEDSLRYLISLYQFQRRVPYLWVEGVKVRLKLDKSAGAAVNIGEGIKAWTLGFTLHPIVVEDPEAIDVVFKAAEVLLETYKIPIPEEEE